MVDTLSTSIYSEEGSFAETVIFPGDPLRAKFIAENYLDDAIMVNSVRNMLAYTGHYKGERVSVMGHGMGVPSISIYATELFKYHKVKKIIRIGTAGAISDDIKVRDIIVSTGAGTASAVNRTRFAGYDYPAVPSFELVTACNEKAKEFGIDVKFGTTFTNDLFYGEDDNLIPALQKMNVLACEMECSELFALAAKYRAKALGILTISDHIITGDETTSEERQNTFQSMMKLALETAITA
ncbi:purine-nucleoside phosphorylase [Vibrio sp. 99-8-1]|uniref:purine-nucleoside phosphorylase n=1 Tax=Vibrio sp. 99-8-1 TaxID=2607602 RepID=UPI0014933158|nr:purine-nucleoside phosphorylase [Vibrio sp. 99-8-1]NOI67511.1 purine-nucleoside phosphorylase [Vibrio sp. 99-8-1]